MNAHFLEGGMDLTFVAGICLVGFVGGVIATFLLTHTLWNYGNLVLLFGSSQQSVKLMASIAREDGQYYWSSAISNACNAARRGGDDPMDHLYKIPSPEDYIVQAADAAAVEEAVARLASGDPEAIEFYHRCWDTFEN